MKITNFLVITLYTLAFLVSGFFLIYISLGLISLDDVVKTIERYYAFELNRFLIGIVGALLIIISAGFILHLLEGLFRKERDIILSGSSGQIKVSLSAIEDVVRRCGRQFLDVKELRPRIVIRRKGLNILSKVTLYAGVNIPEITERLRSLIRERLGKVLGIEDEIKVTIHVVNVVEKSPKILKREGPSREMELGREA